MSIEKLVQRLISDSDSDRLVITEKGNTRLLQFLSGTEEKLSATDLVERLDDIFNWFIQRAEWGITPNDNKESHLVSCFGSSIKLNRFEVSVLKMLSGHRRLVVRKVDGVLMIDYLAQLKLHYEEAHFIMNWFISDKPILVSGLGKNGKKNLDVVFRSIDNVVFVHNQRELKEALAIGTNHIVFSIPGDDPEALYELVPTDLRDKVYGAITSVLSPKICGACAKPTDTIVGPMEYVPTNWVSKVKAGYKIGRGCAACNYSGYHGYIALASLKSDAYKGLNQKSLFESGLPMLADGSLTLEKLAEHAWPIPHRFREELDKPISGKDVFRTEPEKELLEQERRPTVLVVEDDPDQRDILSMVLSSADYKVTSVENGREALGKMRKEIPDLIVSDLMMPEIDGAQLLAKLKSDPIYKNIPVLILTVISDSNKEFDLLSLGADDYCEKTVQRKILLKRVEKLIRRSKASELSIR